MSSRQIPKTKEICSDKKYNDLVYAHLQCISSLDGQSRIIRKKDMNFSAISAALHLSRQTVATKIKNLIDLGLLQKVGEDYELTLLSRDIASLIPVETLELLTDTLNEKSISTYVYLFNRFYAAKGPFAVTYIQMKSWIGVSTGTRSNDSIVKNILTVLGSLGLVEYTMTATADDTGFSNVKTVYTITMVRTTVKKKYACC